MAFQMNDLPNDPPGRDVLLWQAVPGPPGQAVAVAVATPVIQATAVGERSAGGLFVDLPVYMQEELVNNILPALAQRLFQQQAGRAAGSPR